MDQPPEHSSSSTCQLRIVLQDVPTPVWRRLLVSGEDSLGRLCAILQASVGWAGYHKHTLEVGGHEYGMPQSDELLFVDASTGGPPERDENSTTLAQLGLPRHERLRFLYNPRAGWQHEVIIERILAPGGEPLPRCLDGAGACPPEECAGPRAYAGFLAAQLDALHPKHEEVLASYGGTFDPEAFSVTDVNERLSLFWPIPRRERTEGHRTESRW